MPRSFCYLIFLIVSICQPICAWQINDRRRILASLLGFTLTPRLTHVEITHAQDDNGQRRLEFVTDPSTGLQVADILVGGKEARKLTESSKFKIHYTGRLVGKQGWFFENTYKSDEPIRLDFTKDPIVPGLRQGILGIGGLEPMRVGGRRRIVVPSSIGYLDTTVKPVPSDLGSRRRLYSTVMNPTRVQQERAALGGDLAGVVLFDVELMRIYD